MRRYRDTGTECDQHFIPRLRYACIITLVEAVVDFGTKSCTLILATRIQTGGGILTKK